MIRSLHRHYALSLACLCCLSPPVINSYPSISIRLLQLLLLLLLRFASLSCPYTHSRLYPLAALSPVFLPLAIAVCSSSSSKATSPLCLAALLLPLHPFKLVCFFLDACVAFGRISPVSCTFAVFPSSYCALNIVVCRPVRSRDRRAALHCLSLLRVCSSVSFRSLRR